MTLRLVLFGLLLSAAAVLSVVVYESVGMRTASVASHPAPAPPPPLQVSYLVAARALPGGTLVRDTDLAVKQALPDRLPPHAITDSREARASLRGALVSRYIDAGMPVTLADVLRPRDRGFLAAVLSPGTRAVSVGVDPVTGVAGLIWPGDRVDVILTQKIDAPNAPPSRQLLSRTILTNLRVIAVDQQIVEGASGDEKSAGRLARTVTLEVSAEQAEKLAVAQRLGFLSLAIRALKDAPDLMAMAGRPVFGGDVSPELPHATTRPEFGMEIIQGDQRSVVKFP
jgi:pilus assembly protein CpaB